LEDEDGAVPVPKHHTKKAFMQNSILKLGIR